jgi:pantothenate kinase-related protein Tda10
MAWELEPLIRRRPFVRFVQGPQGSGVVLDNRAGYQKVDFR